MNELPKTTLTVDSDGWSPLSTEGIRIGLSDLLLAIECPLKYGYMRKCGLQPSVGDYVLGAGVGLHRLIELRIKAEKNWTLEEWKELANKEVKIVLADKLMEDQLKKEIAKHCHALQEIGLFNGRKMEAEQEISFILCETERNYTSIVHGIIDGVELLGDGTYSITDWKRGGIKPAFLPRYTTQLQSYVLAFRERYRRVVSRAELVFAAMSAEAREKRSYDIPIDDDSIAKTKLHLEAAIKKIVDGDFTPTPSGSACRDCDAQRICPFVVDKELIEFAKTNGQEELEKLAERCGKSNNI
jgi:hypothetical protein